MLKSTRHSSKITDIDFGKVGNEGDVEFVKKFLNLEDEITDELKRQIEESEGDFSDMNSDVIAISNKLKRISKDNCALMHHVMSSGNVQVKIELCEAKFQREINDYITTSLTDQHAEDAVESILNFIPNSHNIFRNYQGKTTGGRLGGVLARSGVKMIFIFMQRMWRVGDELDVDSCVEVMRDAVSEIREIPVAGMFNAQDDNENLPFWSGVTEDTYQFFQDTVLCNTPSNENVSKSIRDAALNLMLEMGLIFGNLSLHLKHVILLIQQSSASKNYLSLSGSSKVPTNKPMLSCKILPMLIRLVEHVKKSSPYLEVDDRYKYPQIMNNPCIRLLQYMKFETITDEERANVDVCLLNAAVVMMNCLDYLTIDNQLAYISWFKSHQDNETESLVPQCNLQKYDDFFEPLENKQERFSHKLYFIKVNTSKIRLDGLSKRDYGQKSHEIIEVNCNKLSKEVDQKYRIKKVVCSGKSIYLLTDCGWLFEVPISSEMNADAVVETFTLRSNSVNHFFNQERLKLDCSRHNDGGDTTLYGKLTTGSKVVDVDTNMYSAHVLVVTANGNVYSWGHNSSGKLGHGDIKERTCPTVIQSLLKLKVMVKQVACGSEHSLILSQSGDIYACGRNHMGQLGLGDAKDRHLATRLQSVTATQIAADGEQSMCINTDGLVMTWGSTFDTCRRHVINWQPGIDSAVSIYRHEVDKIMINENTYIVLLKSGEVYNWLKYCVECDCAEDRLTSAVPVKVKLQIDNVSLVVNGDSEQYYLDKQGHIRNKKSLLFNEEQQFSGFAFVKNNLILSWSPVKVKTVLARPFTLEVSVENLELLQNIIDSITVNFTVPDSDSGVKEASNWFQCFLRTRPSNKYELTEDRLCILISSLHLLSCQLRTVVDEQLTVPLPLLAQLKHGIINCCCGTISQLHPSIKHAAHMCLISGWKILFANQMDKLLGIYYTLQITDVTSLSRYNLIVAMCLDTIDVRRFVVTLIELMDNDESPTIDSVLETFIRYIFSNIRNQLDKVFDDNKTANEQFYRMTNKEAIDDNQSNCDSLDPTEHAIMTKMIGFLKNLLKQVISLLHESKSINDHRQQNIRMILMIYGKIIAQQSIETADYCWTLINKMTTDSRILIQSLHKNGFDCLLINFIESMRWLLRKYLNLKSILKVDSKTPKNSATKLQGNVQMNYFDSVFKFSVTLREMVFLFKPLLLSLDKINRLNDTIVRLDSEDGSLPGSLTNPYTEWKQVDKVVFRTKDLVNSNNGLLVIDDRVYDIDALTDEEKRIFDEYLPDRKSPNITNLVDKCLNKKEILKILVKYYCGEFIDNDNSPISGFDNTSNASERLYLIERMMLELFCDVLLFHQSGCTMIKRSLGFKQLQEFSMDKWPVVLKHVSLKKKADMSQIAAETNCVTNLSTNHFEEKERDEVEETNDISCEHIISSDGNVKMINSCINLLTHGSAASLIEKGESPILLNILQWLHSENFKIKHSDKGSSGLLIDSIHDINLDSLFVLLLIALVRHNMLCSELANHIMKRNYDQPISNELTIIIQNSLAVRKEVIKRHQQNGAHYKDLCVVIIARCKFLIDEIEILNVGKTLRRKSHCFFDIVSDLSPTNRWKWLSIRSKTLATQSSKSIDYWQLVFDVINKRGCADKCASNKGCTTSVVGFDNVNELCNNICQFILCKETIDLQKLRILSLAQKMQYKCIISILKEFRILLQFCNGLLPGVQTSILRFLSYSLNTSNTETDQVIDILQVVSGVCSSNFVSQHLRYVLLQTEKSLIQSAIQILRNNLLITDQNLETVHSLNQRTTKTHIIGVGYWPTSKINFAISHLLVQSVCWSNDICNIVLANGVIGLVQTIFRQYHETEQGLVSIWYNRNENYQLLLSATDNLNKTSKSSDSIEDLNNVEIATAEQLKKGSLVLRGRDWKYGDQDGPNSVGIIKREALDGMVRVQWLNNRKTGSYRAGKDSCYDLQLKKDNDEKCELYNQQLFIPLIGNHKKDKEQLLDIFEDCLWSQPSVLLLHSMGQFMQAIYIQQVLHSSSLESFKNNTTFLSKIFQLLWTIYKHGLLPITRETKSLTYMYREQMSLWCNEHFLLTLISYLPGPLPNISQWIELFLVKTEILVNTASNDQVLNQILTFKIMSKLLDRHSININHLKRLWTCLRNSISSHCSVSMKQLFNVHSLNAHPSKIQIMELSLIFRHCLRPSSVNFSIAKSFLFDKMTEYLNHNEMQILGLSLFCVMTDIENKIYPGMQALLSTQSDEEYEMGLMGIVEKVCDADQYFFTTVAESKDSSFNKEIECHHLNSHVKVDTFQNKFSFQIFENLSNDESRIISLFFASIISKLSNPNEVLLSRMNGTNKLFQSMQLATLVALSAENISNFWDQIQKCDSSLFKLTLEVATRTLSVRSSFSMSELQMALLQLSDNVLSPSDKGDQDSDLDDVNHIDEETEESKAASRLSNGDKKSKKKENARGACSLKLKTNDSDKTLPISVDVQCRIMEMGFTKRQIQAAIRDLSADLNPYMLLNPDLIVTTILSKQIEDEYSLSVDEDDDSSAVDSSEIGSTSGSQSLNFKNYRQRSEQIFIETEDDDDEYENSDENSVRQGNDSDHSCGTVDDEQSCLEEAQDCNEFSLSRNYGASNSDIVTCVKPFGDVVVGDVGLLRRSSKLIKDLYQIYWLRLDCELDCEKEYICIDDSSYSSIKVGDKVQLTEIGIRCLLVSAVTSISVGIVRQVVTEHSSPVQLIVDFPQCLGLICSVGDLEIVSKMNYDAQCRNCLKKPLPHPVYNCISCHNMFLCHKCHSLFYKKHEHKFIVIGSTDSTAPDAPTAHSGNTPSSKSLRCHNLLFQTITVSTNRTELRKCLSFTTWDLQPEPSAKSIELLDGTEECLVKVGNGCLVDRIFILISLSDFLTLPTHAIVKSGTKSTNLQIVSNTDINALKCDITIQNLSKYYDFGSKLMWLKVYQKSIHGKASHNLFNITLVDISNRYRTMFNAVKAIHFNLTKTVDSDERHNKMTPSKRLNNDCIMKSVFTISDRNLFPDDVDSILNKTLDSWRHARVKKLQFQINFNEGNATDGTGENDNGIVNSEDSAISIANTQSKNKLKANVYLWGLNDKEQLGCEATSKVKFPIINEALSELDVVSISGGSKSLFCVTRTGKVYAAGDSSNGRLGITIDTDHVAGPQRLDALDKYFIVKVAVHSGGRHSMALTKNGEVFSWGEGDDGKLGHNSRLKLEIPRKIRFFKDKRVVDVACGSSHSAAIVYGGQLYTWGLGEYGRLGHGDATTKLIPELVKGLLKYKIVQVACGSRDAQTLALSSDYSVWSWGDGDFGKLGRGGSSGCLTPQKIECINQLNVIQIECGAQSSFALTESGQVWTWGKGDYYRLGHGTDKHMREPTFVEDLKDVKIIRLAVGALHCLAVTDQGLIYSWGDNDHGQQGNGTVCYNMRPTIVSFLSGIKVCNVACGSSHSVAWTASEPNSLIPTYYSLNTWPHFPDSINSLADVDFSPVAFTFPLDSLGASDLLDIDTNIHVRKSKMTDIVEISETLVEKSSIKESLELTISQLRGYKTQMSVIQSLFNNLKVLVARKLVSKFMLPLMDGSFSNHDKDEPVDNISASIETFILIFDYLKLDQNSSLESHNFFININWAFSKNLRQMVLLTIIDELEKYGDEELGKTSDLHCYCENKDFVNLLKEKRCVQFVRESPHPYSENCDISGKLVIPGAPRLIVEFDKRCSTERNEDVLIIMDGDENVIAKRSGQRRDDWSSRVIVNGSELSFRFKSDGSISLWGWRFEVKVLRNHNSKLMPGSASDSDNVSEIKAVFSPNLVLIQTLIDKINLQAEDTSLALLLVKALTKMAFTRGNLSSELRLSAVNRITAIISDHNLGVYNQYLKVVDNFSEIASHIDGQINMAEENIPESIVDFDVEEEDIDVNLDNESLVRNNQSNRNIDIICSFLRCLQKIVLLQFKHEEADVKSGKQLFYSRFLKNVLELCCLVKLDSIPVVSTSDEWAWFRSYCLTYRTTESLVTSTSLPYKFITDFKTKFIKDPLIKRSVSRESSITSVTAVSEYADPREFTFPHDVQIINWLRCRPETWKKCWPTDSSSGLEVWAWGHNHRGQLGGVEGSKVKVPVLCDHISALRPRQIIGGEQSLFIVSVDGRVYASGFGNNGRLGICSCESVQTPILVSGLEEKKVVKVAVNSGGKHCLALTSTGLVYAWGEVEDYKLGLGNRRQYADDVTTPTLVNALVRAEIIDIAAGGSHSAAISKSGELYTWGKGRYGRLGHGDGDDQSLPKVVESLKGQYVTAIACGSGDAQSLCITKSSEECDNGSVPNTSVWSWGDGDYGKLGRGGCDICKLPMKIESLEGKGVIKIDCGSQFSLALTSNGEVYTWGKGDYFRLGHGSDSHVRKPELVTGLARKKVIDVACGSLHCICCTEDGDVYSWGDNDEGQLGDGTTTTNSRPRIIETLTGKGINRVACGSAHTFAWTTVSGIKFGDLDAEQEKLPMDARPAFCNLLENKSAASLINRFLLLHYWTEMFCSNLHFFNLNRQQTMDCVRQLLIPSSKESLFRIMIQTSMVGNRKHGPEIKVNRLHASAGTPAGVTVLSRSEWLDSEYQTSTNLVPGRTKVHLEKTVFGQLASKLIEETDCISKNGSVYVPTSEYFLLPNRIWKVKLIGESVDDCGGGYSESMAEICDELQNGHLPLMVPSPDKDCFLLSPDIDKTSPKWFVFLGCLFGIAIRTNQPLSLQISDLIWKILSGQKLQRNDLQLLDKDLLNSLMSLKTMDEEELLSLQIPFSVNSIEGKEVMLKCLENDSNSLVTVENRDEYIESVVRFKIHEFDEVCLIVRRGMSLVIPLTVLNLFSSRELECLVCGNELIPVAFLKSITLYRGIKSDDAIISWFWEIMEEMTNEVRSLFLRFVWGRTRLPRYVSDLRGKEFVIQVLNKYSPADDYLPEAYTCFFLLKLPHYTCKAVLQEKLLYAIHFCKSIDIDDYARISLNPDSLPSQDMIPATTTTTRRTTSHSQSSSSGSNSHPIYISSSSSSSSSSSTTSSDDGDSIESAALVPGAFDSSPSLSVTSMASVHDIFETFQSVTNRFAIQRNNQYLMTNESVGIFPDMFGWPRYIEHLTSDLDDSDEDDDDNDDDL